MVLFQQYCQVTICNSLPKVLQRTEICLELKSAIHLRGLSPFGLQLHGLCPIQKQCSISSTRNCTKDPSVPPGRTYRMYVPKADEKADEVRYRLCFRQGVRSGMGLGNATGSMTGAQHTGYIQCKVEEVYKGGLYGDINRDGKVYITGPRTGSVERGGKGTA